MKLTEEAQRRLVELVYYLDPCVKSCRYINPKGSNDSQDLIEVEGAPTDKKTFEQNVRALGIELANSYERVETHIYFETQGSGAFKEDPHPFLLNSRQLIETSPGVFLYQGALRALMQKLDQELKDLAIGMGAIEQDCPDTVPLSSLQQNGYLGAYPHHACFVSVAKADLKSLSELSGKKSDLNESLVAPTSVLTPTVCYPCFEAMRGQSLSEKGTSITAISKCHRREYKTHQGLERLQTFTMREWIVVGSEVWVSSQLDQMAEKVKSLVNRSGLSARLISATDPFFAGEALKKRPYQSLLGLKKELQLKLPYNDRWIAAGSFNLHRDTLVKSYGIKSETGSQLFSACVGFGLERFALAVLAQHGT